MSRAHSGIILVEVLICLAILSILLPSIHHYLKVGRETYRRASLREKAAFIAQYEHSKLELQAITRLAPDLEDLNNSSFDVHREVLDRSDGTALVRVDVHWETSKGREDITLEQLIWKPEK